MLVKCQHQATASDLPFYNIFAIQKVPFFKIFDDIIACDLWFGPPQSNILATPMLVSGFKVQILSNPINNSSYLNLRQQLAVF